MNLVNNRIRRRRPAGRHRRGVAMVEFAIVANVLFLVIFTCIEFARLNMVRNLVQDAAYFAARTVIVPGATRDEAIGEADRIMGALLAGGYTIDVGEINSSSNEVSVTVSVDFDEVALFSPMFLKDATIESTATMSTERYAGFYRQ